MSVRGQLELERVLVTAARALLRVSPEDFLSVLGGVLQDVARQLDAVRCVWFVLSDDATQVTAECEWCAPFMAPSLGASYTRAELPDSFAGLVAARDVFAQADDADGGPFGDMREVVRSEGIGACLVVPAMSDEQVLGAVAFDFAVGQPAPAAWVPDAIRRFGEVICLGVHRRAELEKAHQIELRLMQKQKLESLGLIAGGVAHDFNNALQVIRVSADLLQDSVDTKDEEGIEHLELILEATESATDLARRMLVFARQELDTVGRANPSQALQRVFRMMERVAPTSVETRLLLDAELPDVPVGTGDFEQAVINLMTNAIHAMPDGGVLTVKAQGVLEDGEPWVCVTVSDSGTGMTPEALERAAEPLYTTKELGEGTGLGLSLVQGIASRAGGQLRIRSTMGEGTSVQLWLPRAARGVTLPPRALPAGMRGTETLLVLEANVLVRRVMHSVLARAGYKVLLAATAGEALEMLRARAEIALVICDSNLSRGNDKALYEVAVEAGIRLPFIVCTASALLSPPGAMHDPAGPFVLPKPWAPHELLAHVRRMLDAPSVGAVVDETA